MKFRGLYQNFSLGAGTTTVAAMASGRNSIGIEIDPNFKDIILSKFKDVVEFSNEYKGE